MNNPKYIKKICGITFALAVITSCSSSTELPAIKPSNDIQELWERNVILIARQQSQMVCQNSTRPYNADEEAKQIVETIENFQKSTQEPLNITLLQMQEQLDSAKSDANLSTEICQLEVQLRALQIIQNRKDLSAPKGPT